MIYPIVSNYVEKWGQWEAVREFVQNAMDSGPYSIERAGESLVIWNDGTIKPSDLLLGMTNKAEGSRGMFGEGMKLAMLVCAREGIECIVSSGSLMLTPKLTEQWGEKVLEVVESTHVNGDNGTYVIIKIPESVYKDKILGDTKPRVINSNRGDIFVGGLYVTTMPEFKRSYNFDPSSVILNRDRDIPSLCTLQWSIASMLNGKELLETAMTGSPEVGSGMGYSVPQKISKAFTARYPHHIPIRSSEQTLPELKGRGIVVPDWLVNLIRPFFPKVKQSSLDHWLIKYSSFLPTEAIDELKEIV